MTAADEGLRLEGRIRDSISLLQEVDRKIYQSTISTGPSTALKHADLFREALSALTSMGEERDRLKEALEEDRRAIGNHWAPNDCYATGPVTGDTSRDLVECPACAFLAKFDALTPQTEAQSHD